MSPIKKFHLFSFPCFGHLVPGFLDFQTGATAAQRRANSAAPVFLPFQFRKPQTAPHGGSNCGCPLFFVSSDQFLKTGLALLHGTALCLVLASVCFKSGAQPPNGGQTPLPRILILPILKSPNRPTRWLKP